MTLIVALPNVWTTIPDVTGPVVVTAVDKGLYVDTTNALTTAQRAQGMPLRSGESFSFTAAAAATPIRVMPANPLKKASVRYQKA